MSELLFGIVTEEIPARMQQAAITDFKNLTERTLQEAGLESTAIDVFVTPRRLTLSVRGLPSARPSFREQRRGPPVDAPKAAQEGFFRSIGMEPEECQKIETPKGTFWVAEILREECQTFDMLPALLEKILHTFPWPKPMRWAFSHKTWVRPIKRLLCLFDGRICPVHFDPEGVDIVAGNFALANRFLGGDAFTVSSFADYDKKMRERFVLIRREERRTLIKEQVLQLAHTQGLEPFPEDLAPGGLIEEVTGLVEWPFAFMGKIDAEFLTLPEEVLVTPMRVHQRYFPLRHAKTQKLAPAFILISANNPIDGEIKIIRGNERVLRARLADARFFWEEDLKKTLSEHREPLKTRLFFENLGTLWDKGERLEQLASIFFPEKPALAEAALLAKADLSTQMVGEFPELQGVMGRRYALEEALSADVAEAIRGHYWPQGTKDLRDPPTLLGRILGILDRMDTLYGFFAMGIMPKGSKDPFALRRAGNGLVELILQTQTPIALYKIFEKIEALYRGQGHLPKDALSFIEVSEALQGFLHERLRYLIGEKGGATSIAPSIVSAALAAKMYDPFDLRALWQQALALGDFLARPVGENLRTVATRVLSILRAEAKKSPLPSGPPNPSLFQQNEEKNLWEDIQKLPSPVTLEALAQLRGAVDTFFEAVTVNAAEASLRQNRLQLLNTLNALLSLPGDLSHLEESR